MKCNIFNEQGLLYLYDELDSKNVELFEQHLKVCSLCRQEMQLLKETVDVFKEKKMDRPSLDCIENIYKKLEGEFFSVKLQKIAALFKHKTTVFSFCSAVVILMTVFLWQSKTQIGFSGKEISWEVPQEISIAMKDINDNLDVLEWEEDYKYRYSLDTEIEDIETKIDELFVDIDKV